MASLVDWRKGVAACDVAVCYRIRSCIPLGLGKVSFHRWFELSGLKKNAWEVLVPPSSCVYLF